MQVVEKETKRLDFMYCLSLPRVSFYAEMNRQVLVVNPCCGRPKREKQLSICMFHDHSKSISNVKYNKFKVQYWGT